LIDNPIVINDDTESFFFLNEWLGILLRIDKMNQSHPKKMVKREIEDEPTDRLKSQQIGQQIGLKVRMTKAINEQLNAALRTVQKSI